MTSLFSRTGLSIDRLRSFLEVIDAGGIARAAPRQPTRQSQLSRQISELEAFFGVELVARHGREISATAEGRELAVVARTAFRALEGIGASQSGAPLPVTLAAGDSVLNGRVVPCLGGSTYDPISLSLRALSDADIAAQLQDGRLDFGILRRGTLPPGLRSISIGQIAYVLHVPRACLRGVPHGNALEVASRVPLALQHGEPDLHDALLRVLSRGGRSPNVRLRCETFAQAERAVASGAFAAVLPNFAVPQPNVRVFHAPEFGPRTTLVLAWPRARERTNAHQTARRCLERVLCA